MVWVVEVVMVTMGGSALVDEDVASIISVGPDKASSVVCARMVVKIRRVGKNISGMS